MIIDSWFFIFLLASLVVLCITLAMHSMKTMEALHHLQKEEHGLSAKLHKKTENILHGAYEKADKIEHDAAITAEKEMDATLNDALKKTLTEVASEMKQEMNAKMLDFTAVISEETKAFMSEIAQKQTDALAKIDADMAVEKASRVETLDKKVAATVDKMSQEILGKSITMSDHETLVLQALEKAKKEVLS